MDKVIIGVDPHKLSATIEVVDDREQVLGSGRFTTDRVGFAAMLTYSAAWSTREWAVEGSLGVGRPLAQRLLEAGERVVDVPAKLAARARLLDTGHGRKTDAHDAHSVAVAAVRAKELRVLTPDGQLEALRMLVDHRDQLSNQRVATINRIQALLAELTPGKAKKNITTMQAKEVLAHVRPRDAAGKMRRRIAAEEVAYLARLDKQIKTLTREIKEQVKERGSNLMDIYGVGPVVAGRILADVGDVARFADRNRFASWTGTAPLDASSGEQNRHRLSRAGNRRMNKALHIAATTQIGRDTEGRAYYRRKLAAGKSHLEAMRCLKRRLSDVVYRQLVEDERTRATGPGGQGGASVNSCATDSHPHIGTSDQPLPGPAQPTLRPAAKNRNPSPSGRLPKAS
ncbi:MAG TPA: IS110 family transposase [Marmoricola sp.]|nr:IS110 family transposase [Marmoricola sp.]